MFMNFRQQDLLNFGSGRTVRVGAWLLRDICVPMASD